MKPNTNDLSDGNQNYIDNTTENIEQTEEMMAMHLHNKNGQLEDALSGMHQAINDDTQDKKNYYY